MSRLHMNRMGLVDFWCYNDEEFHFQNGHMLLRGSNGSGKSVTMQSFIPLLLDGNKSSERLDPFGTRSRKMETYLIDENSDRQERIGYLYLEFKKEDSEIYKTIGMGLHARKSKPLKTWYFVIDDNRRVNYDFRLMEGNLSLTEKQLRNILGNQVISSQSEYMQRVNQVLFGFESIEDFKDAISLLLQLRSPKLSNSLSPAKLNEILSKSLQPLSDEDLRPMSEAMTSMDDLQDQLDSLKQSLEAAQTLDNAYALYNKAQLFEKWKKYNGHEQTCKKIQKDIFDQEKQKTDSIQLINEKTETLNANTIQYEIKKNEYNSLKNSDVEKWLEAIQELEKIIDLDQQTLIKKDESLEQKSHIYQDSKNNFNKYNDECYQKSKRCKEFMSELDNLNDNMNLSEHIALKNCFENQERNYNFSYTKSVIQQEIEKVDQGLKKWQRYEEIEQRKDFYDNQKNELMNQIEKIEMNLEKAQENYHQIVEEYQEYFHHYHQNNQFIHFTNEQFIEIRNLLVDYENTQQYQSIQQIVNTIYQKGKNMLYQKEISIKNKLNELNKQLHDLKNDYEMWLHKEDVEPEISKESANNRNYLKKQGIPFVSFYQLLEFSDDLSLENKNRIEELLVQMHLLDALVIESKYKHHIYEIPKGCKDYYLWTTKNIDQLDVVQIKKIDNEADLLYIFNQLSIEGNEVLSINHHYFKSGVIEGSLSGTTQAQYIGFKQRLKTKEMMIEQLTLQIKTLNIEINNLNDCLGLNKKDQEVLENEFVSFKGENDLKESFNVIIDLQKQNTFYQEKVNEIDQSIKNQQVQLDKIYNELQILSQALSLKVNYNAFVELKDSLEEYQNLFYDFQNEYEKWLHLLELKKIEESKIEEYEVDLDNLKVETNNLKQKIEINQGKKNSLQKQLDDAGYQDLTRHLEKLQRELNDLEAKSKNLEKDIIVSNNNIEHINLTLDSLKEDFNEKENIKKIYREIYEEELRLNLVNNSSIENEYQFIQKISQDLSSKKSLSDYQTQLQRVYFEQMTYLTQYNVLQENIQPSHIVEDISSRIILKARHLGKNVSFMQLIEQLKKNIETQELLIVEEDKHIFEDILVNNISKKIRDYIQSSKRWVETIQSYIQEMNTSSGLQLQLKWKSKKAINDEELDTQELVELLEKDYYVLKESDRQKISNHFRKKIEMARQMSRDENVTASFHQLMKDVMDYREWFDFTIFAKKPNENRKELTSHVFFSYSGGEKAISMYIPLFSAVAAKFASARKDAPLLIALDEAFAGVDEKNIDNMFKLITKFEFDYIMNSQVLWGDYPSCPSLAIYELFRPNNAPYVTVVSYIWNGFVKRLVV